MCSQSVQPGAETFGVTRRTPKPCRERKKRKKELSLIIPLKPTSQMSAPKRRKTTEIGVAFESQYAEKSPFDSKSPYHAFSGSPPVTFGDKSRAFTTVRSLWNETAFYVCFELEGSLASAGVQDSVQCILHDGVLASRSHTMSSCSSDDGGVWEEQLTVGWDSASSPVPSGDGLNAGKKTVIILTMSWTDSEEPAVLRDPTDAASCCLGLNLRGPPKDKDGLKVTLLRMAEGDIHVYSYSWQPSGLGVANFPQRHTNAGLGHYSSGKDELKGPSPKCAPLRLLRDPSLDCSCCAVRLLAPHQLELVASPIPDLNECPPGSLLVRTKFASICGSDIPFFKAREMKAPSSYWDRDGFCGHEVIGVVVESKSASFQAGDSVMALPSSYFKVRTDLLPYMDI